MKRRLYIDHINPYDLFEKKSRTQTHTKSKKREYDDFSDLSGAVTDRNLLLIIFLKRSGLRAVGIRINVYH